MQSRLPSSLYSIIRVPWCAQWTHYDQKPACQSERKTLWSRARTLHKSKRDNQKWLFGLAIRHRTLSN